MATEHTATPWQLRDEFEHGPYCIIGNVDYNADGTSIDYSIVVADVEGSKNDRANAEFIVRSANAHYALVEALKNAVIQIVYKIDPAQKMQSVFDGVSKLPSHIVWPEWVLQAIKTIRLAEKKG